MNIRPGLNVRIVTGVDTVREEIRVGGATVYEADDSALIVSQLDPPIPESMLGASIEITYLVTEENERARYGFSASVKGFVEDYCISKSERAQVVVLARAGKERPYNLRRFYRVQPTSRSGLVMHIRGEQVNLLDISLGGARISFRKNLLLQSNSSPQTVLEIDSAHHRVDARIARVWDGKTDGLSQELAFAAIEFFDMDAVLEQILSKKIREIEMENRRMRL